MQVRLTATTPLVPDLAIIAEAARSVADIVDRTGTVHSQAA